MYEFVFIYILNWKEVSEMFKSGGFVYVGNCYWWLIINITVFCVDKLFL